MPNQIPPSLKGLRVRLVTLAPENSTGIEQVAYGKLNKLLAEHGQHLSETTLALFRQSLNGLLLHGLRARPIDTRKAASDSTRIRFVGSDGRHYTAPEEAWTEIQKADKGAKLYSPGSKSETPKRPSLAESLFDQASNRA